MSRFWEASGRSSAVAHMVCMNGVFWGVHKLADMQEIADMHEMINDSSIELLLVRNRIREHRQAVSSRF